MIGSKRFMTRLPHPRLVLKLTLAALLLLMVMNFAGTGRLASAANSPKAYVGLFKDNAVAVIDTGSNKVLTTIPVPTGPHGLAVTPDGRTVYVSSDGDSKVSIIDTTTDTVTGSIEVGKTPHGLTLSPDGKLLIVSVFGAGQVVFVDTSSNQIVGQVDVASPHNTAISLDGQTAYVSANYAAKPDAQTALVIIDLVTHTVKGSVSLPKPARTLNFSHDGKHLYFTMIDTDAVQVLDPANNQIVATVPVGASPHHALFTPDGEYALVVSQKTNELAIIDEDNKVSATVPVGKNPHWIATTADSKMAYVTDEASNDVSIVDLEAHKVISTISVGQAPRKIVIQPAVGAGMAATATAAK
jgi:YVTN family beta-propeller protein